MIADSGKHYLYRHIRLDKNEPFYVGIGTKDGISECTSNYKRSYDYVYRNKFWKRITKKTSYKIEIVLESDDYNFIQEKEIEFIALYGRKDLNLGPLCNLTDGGGGGKGSLRTVEHREKISKKLKGLKVSEETLIKRKENWKRINKNGYIEVSKKLSKPVLQLDKSGNLIKEWKSISETSLEGYQISRVSNCCNGKRPFHKGYIWKFKNA